MKKVISVLLAIVLLGLTACAPPVDGGEVMPEESGDKKPPVSKSDPEALVDGSEETWDRIIAVDLKSVWLCLKYEIRYMAEHGGGSIVNTSSIAGLIGAPMQAMYTACKHGVNGLTLSAAGDYAKAGIRVNAVCPAGMSGTGFFNRMLAAQPGMAEAVKEMVPLGRDSKPEEVAEAVLFLATDATFMTGSAVIIDGGSMA